VTLSAGVEIIVTLREGVPTRLETYPERGGGRELLQLPGRQVRGTIEDADERELVMLLPGRDRGGWTLTRPGFHGSGRSFEHEVRATLPSCAFSDRSTLRACPDDMLAVAVPPP